VYYEKEWDLNGSTLFCMIFVKNHSGRSAFSASQSCSDYTPLADKRLIITLTGIIPTILRTYN
jgi:hypothetical protein